MGLMRSLERVSPPWPERRSRCRRLRHPHTHRQAVTEDGPPAQSPSGRQRSPIEVEPGTNVPTRIDGRLYSGYAIDRMHGRGIPASVVEDAIKNGAETPGKTPGTTRHRGMSGTVVIVGQGGKVTTVY